ncbi:MAG: SCO family protein [bacterium]
MKNRRSPFLVIGGILLVGAVATLAALSTGRDDEPLPVLAQVPPFALIATDGTNFGDQDLAGHPYVADLIFTHCAAICPRMTAEMGRLERETRSIENLRFVSVSVDPERDTPDVLRAYAERSGADRERWVFLTGEKADIWRLASEGYLLPVVEGKPELGDDAIIHSQYFVLVDGTARIRGVYDMRDSEAMLRLRGDIRRLNDDPPGAHVNP